MSVVLTVFRCVDGALTEVGTLNEAFDVSWAKSRLDVGAASFSIPHDTPSLVADPDLLTYGSMVAIEVDDVERFALLIRRRQRVAGDSYDTITLTGPSITDLLSDALVFPRGGLDAIGADDQRVFTWTTAEYDSSAWGPVSGPLVGEPLSTPGFPDPLAVGYEPIFPGGRALYRRLAESQPGLEGPARMVLAATVGTQVVVYLDGQEVMRKRAGQRGLIIADVDYQAYDQQIAVEVVGGTGRWGWTWIRLVDTDPEDLSGDWRRLFFDDSGWDTPEVDGDGVVSTPGWPDPAAVAYRADGDLSRFRRTIDTSAVAGATMTVVGRIETRVRVWLNDVLILEKPSGETGLFTVPVDLPATGTLAVAAEGGGRWAMTWQDPSDNTLLSTYDPDVASPANPWRWLAGTFADEVAYGQVIRRTFDPSAFPAAATWSSFEAGGIADWTGLAFDDSSWGSPIVSPGVVSTPGWPDPAAVAYASDTTWGHYRRKVGGDVAGQPARLYVVATAQTQVHVYLDEVPVLVKPSALRGVFEAEVPYPPSEQQLAVAVIGTGRWALNWRAGADGSGTSLKRTYDPATTSPAEPWLYVAVPYQGVTLGSVMTTLVEEAQARNALPCMVLGFTVDEDSAGQPWAEYDWAMQVGDDTILSVCERARDHGIDVEAKLGKGLIVLDAWQRRGVDRGATPASGVSTVTVPLDECERKTFETEDEVFDRLLIRTQWGWALRPELLTDAVRAEGFVSLGMHPSEEGAIRLADDLIGEFAVPRPVVRWMWTQGGAGPEPDVDFGLGDVLVGPWLDPAVLTGGWQSADVRINTLGGRATDSGIVWTHEGGTP